MSAYKFLDPDKIMFYYDTLPKPDFFNYDTWFDRLQNDIAVFNTIKITENGVCNSTVSRKLFLLDLLYDLGGVYLEESTILTKNPENLFNTEITVRLGIDGSGYLAVIPKLIHTKHLENDKFQYCQNFEFTNQNSTCLVIRKRVHPKQFWGKLDLTSKTINMLLYDYTRTPIPRMNPQRVVPNIAHMLWIGGREVTFMMYLSCMSLIHVAKVDTLFLHGDMEPHGNYWEKLKHNEKFKFIQITLPNLIYGTAIKRRSHMSDVFRAVTLLRYGGIYSDVDVIWTQPINKEISHYDAVASYDWAHAYYPYPDYINLGVSIGRRGAPFWLKLIESMKDFRDDIFGYNGLLKPYKIYEEHPDLLLIHENLQVMCFKNKCYPGGNMTEEDTIWHKDTYAYHWTWPTPVEFHNETALIQSKSKWSEIGKNVLKEAGLLVEA